MRASPAFEKLAPGSKKNIEISWKKLAPLRKRRIRDLKITDYQKIVDAAAARGTGRDGCAKIKTLISILCQNAMLDDIIIRDSSEGLTLPERTNYVQRRNFTQDEILTLFYNDDDRTARLSGWGSSSVSARRT